MAGNRKGKAVADWISESSVCAPGKPLQTAIRLVHQAGWHSYWVNPGEAGLKTSVSWKLPVGWNVGEFRFPAPGRFATSGLAGFGYEGTVLFPVIVTPPADFTGSATLTAVVSWLACGETGCVPGEAEIHLSLSAGAITPTRDAPEIIAAHQKLPRVPTDFPRLVVSEQGSKLTIVVEPAPGATLDLDGREFFPATPDVIDPKFPVKMANRAGKWTAEVPKSEYAASPVRSLTLVLGPHKEEGPIELTWTKP